MATTTKKQTHTAGPWEQIAVNAVGKGEVIICTLPTRSSTSAITYGEMEANARLIAVAPELLELLKEYCEPSGAKHFHQDDWQARCIAAIRKATV